MEVKDALVACLSALGLAPLPSVVHSFLGSVGGERSSAHGHPRSEGMTRLLLVRHGETAWNAQGRLQGQIDVPLSDVGKRHAMALAGRLAGEVIHAAYASDLQRAWETATTIAAPHRLMVHTDPRLREIAFGTWEGLTYDEVRQQDPRTLADWQVDPMKIAAPGGESLADVVARVQAILRYIAGTHRDQTVLLVAHGGSLRVLICLALGLVPQGRWQFQLGVGSLSELYLHEQGAVLTLLNDTHHLTGVANGG